MIAKEYGDRRGQTIVLLHGGGLSWWNYRRVAELLGDQYHLLLPLLHGHAGSGRPFISIEENAEALLEHIDRAYGGEVLALGGLSLGAQIVVEMLARRPHICRYALLESASVIAAPLTRALLRPAVAASYGLVARPGFARAQARALHLPQELFDDYYRDSRLIARADMTAMLEASAAYRLPESVGQTRARAAIFAGGREPRRIRRSAELLRRRLNGSSLTLLAGYAHGQLSLSDAPRYRRELLRLIEEE